MTSWKQIEANRRNARKSTGPVTPEGKLQSRRNAVRHGLTAETVMGALEDAEDYMAFEAAIIPDYDAQSAVERELVLRLASVLWRLRRATTMETGLFEIQATHQSEIERTRQLKPAAHGVVHALFRPHGSPGFENARALLPITADETAIDPNLDLAHCFLGLANLPNFALDRLSRYEAALWRQARQVLFALDCLDRRKPQERRHHLGVDRHQELASYPRGEY